MLDNAKGLMEKAGTDFLHLVPDKELSEYIDAVVIAFPTTFFVDSEGNLVASTCGAKSLEEWKAFLDKQLEEQR